MLGRLPLIAMALAVASPCFAQTVTDGDTLKQGGATYRLWGIGGARDAGVRGAIIDPPELARPAVRRGVEHSYEAGGQLEGGRLGHPGEPR